MLSRILKYLRRHVGDHAIPVAKANEDFCPMVQLAHKRLEFVAAVAVEKNHLSNSLSLQGINQVGQQVEEGSGRDTARERSGNLQMIGVDPIWDGRQEDDLGTGVVGPLARAAANGLDLVSVRAVRHMKVVWFGSAERQYGDLPLLGSNRRVI